MTCFYAIVQICSQIHIRASAEIANRPRRKIARATGKMLEETGSRSAQSGYSGADFFGAPRASELQREIDRSIVSRYSASNRLQAAARWRRTPSAPADLLVDRQSQAAPFRPQFELLSDPQKPAKKPAGSH